MTRRFATARRFIPELLVLFVVATTPRVALVAHRHAGGERHHVHLLGAAHQHADAQRRASAARPDSTADGVPAVEMAGSDTADHLHWQHPFVPAALASASALERPEIVRPLPAPSPCGEPRAALIAAPARAPPHAASSPDR